MHVVCISCRMYGNKLSGVSRLDVLSTLLTIQQLAMLSDVGTLDEAFRLFQHPLPVYHPTLLEFILYAGKE
jgi:hypothetical protein